MQSPQGLQLIMDSLKRNMMASLLFSIGVPMISGGDELSRTQQGSNNAVRFRLSQTVLLRRKYVVVRAVGQRE